MKNYCLIVVAFLALNLFYSCGEKTKTPVKVEEKVKKEAPKKVVPKIKKEKKTPKKLPKITYEFLEQYGKDNPETKIKLITRFGDIYVTLFKDTPLHRASFLFLAKEGYFDTTSFHRIVEDFIIQGGNSDNEQTVRYRTELKNYRILPEFRKNRKHKRGALAIARSWDNNPKKLSTPFEFYFILSPKGEHHLDGEHTVFGQVTKGFDVMDKISKVKVDRDEWPYEDVDIKIEILE
ncbi:peptidylprolyl isomerase [Aureivirga sp. CE67]|uniref:peptidylprolyl isomerase n=1 Tax=Aureivirga sp. CE67 TaxID=1788983 RepID=UPI0018CB1E4E|nr:peptidylprolyl isomerase [Aureivirga sp. CE67]